MLGCAALPLGLSGYSLEHDRFDILAQVLQHSDRREAGLLLEDNQVPILYSFGEHHRRDGVTVEFLEFEECEQGWRFKKTSRYDALKQGLPAFGTYRLRLLGNREHMYAFVDTPHKVCPVGLFLLDRQASKFVHQPFSTNHGEQTRECVANRMCTFTPQFDVLP